MSGIRVSFNVKDNNLYGVGLNGFVCVGVNVGLLFNSLRTTEGTITNLFTNQGVS